MSVAAPGEPAQIEAMSIEHGVHGQCLLCKCFVPHSNGLNSNLMPHIDTNTNTNAVLTIQTSELNSNL